jgi:hypothetical protein
MSEVLVCTLAEARERAGLAGGAPVVASRLREGGAGAVCIVAAPDGMHWMDTPQARGWLRGKAQDRDSFAAAMQRALAQGFVAADAAVVAGMEQPQLLPLLSWGDEPPADPVEPVAARRLDL